MDHPPIEPTADRIVRLERAVDLLEQVNRELADTSLRRSLGRLVLAAALGSACAFLAERYFVARSSKDISAERFPLRDTAGRKRAELAMSRAGAPVLFFYDERGKNRLRVFTNPDGSAGINIFDEGGRTRFAMGLEEGEKRVILAFLGSDGKFRMSLSTEPDSPTSLVLYDPTGQARAALGVEQGGSGGISFLDQVGKTTYRIP